MKLLSHFFYIIILFLFACSSNKDNYIDQESLKKLINSNKFLDINSFILEKFDTHQIVVLGENKHHERIYKQDVIKILNDWIDRIHSKEINYNKIGLILEYSSIFKEKLNIFFSNGDISELIIHPNFLLNVTTADLEFWHALRSVNNRIQILNKNRSSKEQIEFEIICPEKDPPRSVTREESYAYIQKERDIETANKIIEVVKRMDGFKFLGCFGAAHIPKKKTPDNNMPRLVNVLNKNGIKTFSIYRSLMSENKFGIVFSEDEKSFALPLNIFNGPGPYFSDDYFDAWIFYNGSYFNDLKVVNIPSLNLIKNYIKFSQDFSENFLVPLRWIGWYRLTGEKVAVEQDLIDYIQFHVNNINPVEIVDNFKFIDNIIESYKMSNVPVSVINKTMINITGLYNSDNLNKSGQENNYSIEFWENYVKENKYKIKLRLLTAVLFYGTKKEKEQAVNELRTLTNMDFSSSNEWLNWYREQF